MAGWNATSAPGYFQEQSLSADPEVNVTDESLTMNASHELGHHPRPGLTN
jgi:hypothetical protein